MPRLFVFLKIFLRYVDKANTHGSFFLACASDERVEALKSVFNSDMSRKYSEILFSPVMKIVFSGGGKPKPLFGFIDNHLSNNLGVSSSLVRQ